MKKTLTENQKRLLQKLIIAAVSFVLGFLPNSELLQKIIEFINTLFV